MSRQTFKSIPRTGRLHWLGFLAMLWSWAEVSSTAEAMQEEPLIPKRCHVWGRFDVGAWSRVEVQEESYDAQGDVKRVERTIVRTLHESDDQQYILHVATASENGRAPRQENQVFRELEWYVTRDKLLRRKNDDLSRTIKLVDREVECQVYEYRQGPEGKESTHQDFFTATVFPHFLKRTVLRPSPNNQQPFPYALAYEVIATDLPVTRGERLLNAAETRTIIREPEKTTVIVELISDEVPGGLITKRTTQRAKDGRLLKRETVELDDFGMRTEPGEEQTRRRLFREWRQGLRERRTNRAGGGR